MIYIIAADALHLHKQHIFTFLQGAFEKLEKCREEERKATGMNEDSESEREKRIPLNIAQNY